MSPLQPTLVFTYEDLSRIERETLLLLRMQELYLHHDGSIRHKSRLRGRSGTLSTSQRAVVTRLHAFGLVEVCGDRFPALVRLTQAGMLANDRIYEDRRAMQRGRRRGVYEAPYSEVA